MRLPASYWFSILRERAVTFDPGLTNLLLATRATASVLLAVLVLYTLTHLASQPPTLMLIGGAMALISVMATNDPTRRQQQLTFLLLPLPAMLAITAGALLASSRIAGDAVFVAIIFAAVYIRRYGPRGFAFGLLAFITYFIGMFLAPSVEALPWLLGPAHETEKIVR